MPPQPPQWRTDDDRSAHDPLQLVSPSGQLEAQPLGVQTCVPPHAVVQDPHVPGLVRSASHPSVGFPSQSAKPG